MSGPKQPLDPGTARQSSRIVGRLKFYFATLSCLGGLVLSAGSETESIPVIAVFFAVFGYVFVDYLRLFALPPIAAYAAMALAAFYCVSDFADLDAPGNHQMVAVAQLLVFVQAILMMQKKSRRIFEQLGVFCLLELIVAAVFNNAITYGLLLIPIGIIGARALSLLAAVSATEGLDLLEDLDGDDDPVAFLRSANRTSSISVSSPDSVRSLASVALRLPRLALVALAPSVLLVGAVFFYALPRTTDAARVQNRGSALVGFSDELYLEQMGQMLQSTQTAMRIYLSDQATGQAYSVRGGIYLRGRVLERYTARMSGERNTASWNSTPERTVNTINVLPPEFYPQRSTDENFYDSVVASIVCESMRSNALFAVAPYHRLKSQRDVVHCVDRWTLARATSTDWVYPRKSYRFGTKAFWAGDQTELIGRAIHRPRISNPYQSDEIVERLQRARRFEAEREAARYVDELLKFDVDAMPTAGRLASQIVDGPSGKRRSDYQIAQAMAGYLSTSTDYQYTLDLSAESIPGLDPIEQFLSVDRRGHCQYFASALAMMLRSQDIPARVVVGYYTDEFNELGQHYVARQLHAHSWVEALIDRDQLLDNRIVYGQPQSEQYWLRLDPTPSAGRIVDSPGGVTQYLDAAQNMWDDYVVDMDSGRQEGALMGGGLNPMSGSYQRMVDWLSLTMSRIRAGELGGGSLASRNLFSWPAAVLGVLLTMTVALLLRFRPPSWVRRQFQRKTGGRIATPEIAFYAETLDQLARVGVSRQPAQTPDELTRVATRKLAHPMIPPIDRPLEFLTAAFYRIRFGRPSAKDSRAETEQGDLEADHRKRHAARTSPDSDRTVQQALDELKRSVDLIVEGGGAVSGKRTE